MFYEITEENAIAYVVKTPIYSSILKDATDLKSKDLALGNINSIFRIFSESDPDKSVILKQALPYAKKYPEFKLPQERAVLEADVLKIENEYCPDSSPALYYFDSDMFINLMEDANEHLIMREGLMQQLNYPKFAKQIGEFLARTLFFTSDFFLPSDKKKAMVNRFTNPVMCKITEDLIFTEPWKDHPNNNWTKPYLDGIAKDLQNDKDLRRESLLMKEAFMMHTEALIHGDLHTGSIMINPDEIKVIDPEFAYFGPMGFDIGAILGNLVLSYASQEYHAQDSALRGRYQEWLLETIKNVWSEFEQEFRKLWKTNRIQGEWESEEYLNYFLLHVLQDSVGFGACKITRRLFGLAHVPDMWEIPDDRMRARCESIAFNGGRQWLLQRRNVTSPDDIIRLVKEYAKPDKSLN